MKSNTKLKRGLGGLEATSLVVGGIIGTTIFLVTSDVANVVGSPILVMVTWLLAGLLAGAADIQQTLAYGAHGPKELLVLLLNA